MLDPAWVALSLVDHVGGKTLRALLAQFGDPRAVLDADERALRRVPGVGPKIASAIKAVSLPEVESALARWLDAGVRALPWDHPDYPARLRALDDAPPTLFVLGHLPDCARAVAVVGTRSPSPDAERVALRLGAMLAGQGQIVVSGLALGIDRAAHLGALAARQGVALAVLGSGVLQVYPRANARLARSIAARGALVSEVEPLAPPTPARLVARNRLISGLADTLIVVETGSGGGAMHAARRAFDQGRAVYALDFPASGNRALIASGALPLAPDLSNLPR